MKTLAAILVELSNDLEIDYVQLPKLGKNQVIVKILSTAICGTQLSEIFGIKGEDKWLPHLMGHEACGVVLEIGSEVKKVKKDDLVIASWLDTSGINAGGSKYTWGNRIINAGPITTFQEISVISENKIIKSPSKEDLDKCCFLGCAIPTGFGMIKNVAKNVSSKKIMIMGAGGIGLNSIVAAKELKASQITVIEKNKNKYDLIKKFGADTICSLDDLNQEHINSYDFIFDASGSTYLMENSIKFLKQKSGKLIIAGNAAHDATLKINPSIFNQGKSILGTWGGDTNLETDINGYYKILKKNIEKFDDFVSNKFSLEEINIAIKKFRNGEVLRPLINFDD